jgi:Mrp family chromosome partitioning ATPase
MVVKKAVKMARLLEVPVLGLVENMTAVRCPGCGREIPIFGQARAAEAFGELGLKVIGSLPLDPRLSELADKGKIEDYEAGIFQVIPSLVEGGPDASGD